LQNNKTITFKEKLHKVTKQKLNVNITNITNNEYYIPNNRTNKDTAAITQCKI